MNHLKLIDCTDINATCYECKSRLGAIEIHVPPGAVSSPTEIILCKDCGWRLAALLKAATRTSPSRPKR